MRNPKFSSIRATQVPTKHWCTERKRAVEIVRSPICQTGKTSGTVQICGDSRRRQSLGHARSGCRRIRRLRGHHLASDETGQAGDVQGNKWLAIMPRSEKDDTERAEALVVLVRGDVAAQLHRNVLRQMT